MKDIHLNLTDEQLTTIEAGAKKMGMERSDFIRYIIYMGFLHEEKLGLFPYQALRRGVKKKGTADK